jgi:hypothetical protein
MRQMGWLTFAAVAALGCSGTAPLRPGDTNPDASSAGSRGNLTTDSAAYTATRLRELWPGVWVYGFRVVTRFTNPTAAPVYLWTCYPNDRSPIYSVVAAGQRTSSGVAYNSAWACVGHDRPIRVDPGATHVDTLNLRGPNSFDGVTHRPIDPVLEGRFQIVFGVQSCRTEGDCPIREAALTHSSEFTVRRID